MSGNNSSSCSSLDALQSLGAAEPSWVITSQPALWDTITPLWEIPNVSNCPLFIVWLAGSTYVLNDMAVIADEEEGTALGQIELHSDQSWNG